MSRRFGRNQRRRAREAFAGLEERCNVVARAYLDSKERVSQLEGHIEQLCALSDRTAERLDMLRKVLARVEQCLPRNSFALPMKDEVVDHLPDRWLVDEAPPMRLMGIDTITEEQTMMRAITYGLDVLEARYDGTRYLTDEHHFRFTNQQGIVLGFAVSSRALMKMPRQEMVLDIGKKIAASYLDQLRASNGRR